MYLQLGRGGQDLASELEQLNDGWKQRRSSQSDLNLADCRDESHEGRERDTESTGLHTRTSAELHLNL